MLSEKEFVKILVQIETVPDNDSDRIKIIHLDLDFPKSEELKVSSVFRHLIIKGIIKEQMLKNKEYNVGEIINLKNDIALNIFTVTITEEVFAIVGVCNPEISTFNGYDYDIKIFVRKIDDNKIMKG